MRILYFSMAALWGFAVGAVSLMGTLVVMGRPLAPDTRAIWLLCGAGLMAMIGGLVIDAAYRETGRRVGWRRR